MFETALLKRAFSIDVGVRPAPDGELLLKPSDGSWIKSLDVKFPVQPNRELIQLYQGINWLYQRNC
jgi:hypothetical protein